MAKKLSKQLIKDLKEKLIKEKKKLLGQIEELKQEDPFTDPDHASDNAAVDTDVREQVGHETIEAQINDLKDRVEKINSALLRIEKSSYGVCLRCKKPIALKRLKLIPEAGYCINCEKSLRK